MSIITTTLTDVSKIDLIHSGKADYIIPNQISLTQFTELMEKVKRVGLDPRRLFIMEDHTFRSF